MSVYYNSDPPTYVESVGGAVNLWDDDDDDNSSPESNMGDLTYTPMYAYVYNYRPPPSYSEVAQVDDNVFILLLMLCLFYPRRPL